MPSSPPTRGRGHPPLTRAPLQSLPPELPPARLGFPTLLRRTLNTSIVLCQAVTSAPSHVSSTSSSPAQGFSRGLGGCRLPPHQLYSSGSPALAPPTRGCLHLGISTSLSAASRRSPEEAVFPPSPWKSVPSPHSLAGQPLQLGLEKVAEGFAGGGRTEASSPPPTLQSSLLSAIWGTNVRIRGPGDSLLLTQVTPPEAITNRGFPSLCPISPTANNRSGHALAGFEHPPWELSRWGPGQWEASRCPSPPAADERAPAGRGSSAELPILSAQHKRLARRGWASALHGRAAGSRLCWHFLLEGGRDK